MQNVVDELNNTRYEIMTLQEKDGIITLDNGKVNSTASKAAIPAPPTPPLSTKTKDAILSALSLDLLTFPCPSRHDPNTNITIVEDKFPTQATQLLILVVANKWDFDYDTISYKEKLHIARAASLLVAYDNGFKCKFSTKSIMRW